MRSDKPELSVVVPLHNEEGVVHELFERLVVVLEATGRTFEVVFVDDGSRDTTLELIRELAHSSTCLTVIELSRNYGQTAAIAAGVDNAQGLIIITMDGDLQHLPEEIPQFLKYIDDGFDLVNGTRQRRNDNALTRRLPSFLANRIAKYLCGVQINDFGSTYKAYRAELVKQLQLFGELHRFVPILAARVGARMKEIPITIQSRAAGRSNYGLARTFGVFEDIVFLVFYTRYLTKPMRAFGFLFFSFFGGGFSIAALLMLLWSCGAIAAVYDHAALLLFSVFLMIVGIQFLVAGVLAELLSRIYLQTRNDEIYSVRSLIRRRDSPLSKMREGE
jgi:glycosyltransferase involved in cell wall biosynthesis